MDLQREKAVKSLESLAEDILMFGLDGFIAGLAHSAARLEEERLFERWLDTLPFEHRMAARAERAVMKERQRQEEIAERRHRELVQAIRDSRFRLW